MGSDRRIRSLARGIRNSRAVTGILRGLPSAGGMVLRYHSVNDDPVWRREYVQSSLVVTPEVFDRQVAFLASTYRIVSLDAIVERLHEGRRPERDWVAITFDDGYEDNATLARPILSTHGATGTFYITTGAVGNGDELWTVRLRRAIMRTERDSIHLGFLGSRSVSLDSEGARENAIKVLTGILKRSRAEDLHAAIDEIVDVCGDSTAPDRQVMMSWDQVRELRRSGMTIGGHTVHHYNLPCQTTETVRREIADSKAAIERELGETITHFAYPDGRTSRHFDERSAAAAAEAGYLSAATSLCGAASPRYSPYSLPRLGIVPRDADVRRLASDIEFGRRTRPCHPCVDALADAGIVPPERATSGNGGRERLGCDGATAS